MSKSINIQIKWRGLLIRFDNVDTTDATIGQLKLAIEEKTGIAPCDQKLIGLGVKLTNTTAEDGNVKLCDAKYKEKNGIVGVTLMGTPQLELIEQRAKELDALGVQNKLVFNDLDLDNISPATRAWRKLQEFSTNVDIQFLNPPRPGKKLLILDLDHTLLHFDSRDDGLSRSSSAASPLGPFAAQNRSTKRPTAAMKRPYMDYFLSCVYAHYDIAIWSQTHWKWIEIKLTELGMIPNPHYRICFVLDKTSMFKMPPTGYVKPIYIVWSKFGNLWNKTNTLHVDDLDRNFILNKSSGVLVTPFYRLGYVNTKNDILTHTLSTVAYGPQGMILSALSTTTNNYFYQRQSFACPGGAAGSFPEPGATRFPAPGGGSADYTTATSHSLLQGSQSSPSGGIGVESEDAAEMVCPPQCYTLNSSTFVHPAVPPVCADFSNIFAVNSSFDVELYFLARYLCNISHSPDVSTINHSRWRLHCHVVKDLPVTQATMDEAETSMQEESLHGQGSISSCLTDQSGANQQRSVRIPQVVDRVEEGGGSGARERSTSESGAAWSLEHERVGRVEAMVSKSQPVSVAPSPREDLGLPVVPYTCGNKTSDAAVTEQTDFEFQCQQEQERVSKCHCDSVVLDETSEKSPQLIKPQEPQEAPMGERAVAPLPVLSPVGESRVNAEVAVAMKKEAKEEN